MSARAAVVSDGRWRLWTGVLILAVLVLAGSVVEVFDIWDAQRGDLDTRLAPPSLTAGHVLGTDNLGRDMLVRALSGVLWSIAAALTATGLAATIGTALALLAAERGGLTRIVVELAVNSVIALPAVIIAVIVTAIIGSGWLPIVLTLGLMTWPVFGRVVLAEALSLRTRDYVHAARLMGQSRSAVVFRHVLPALRPTLLVMGAFHFADMLVAEGALSFLGLAAPLGEPTWGNMLADSRPFVFSAPWMLFVPASAIVVSVIAANLIGDGLTAVLHDERR